MDRTWLSQRNNHTYENTRRYHGFKPTFPFPNDAAAKLHHGILLGVWRRILDNRHFTAPITPLKKSHKVLDVATQSGGWPMELYVNEVLKPRITAMDPNVMLSNPARYVIHCELEGQWPFTAKQAFHLIHAQSLGGFIGDWEGLYRNAYRHLVPGGWFEVHENDLRLFGEPDGAEIEDLVPHVSQWQDLLEQTAEQFGKRVNVGVLQRGLMEEAGFEEVTEEVFEVPLGPWSEDPKWKAVGKDYQYSLREGLEGYSLRLFTQTLGWSKDETDALLDRVRTELEQEGLHLYSYFRVVKGRKLMGAGR